jgi:hypothetical protein
MPTANRFKVASMKQKVFQPGRRGDTVRGMDSTDEFMLSMGKPAARSSASAITASGWKISRTLWMGH